MYMYFSSVKSDSEELLPECSISVKEIWSEDNSSSSTYGNFWFKQLQTIKYKAGYSQRAKFMHVH